MKKFTSLFAILLLATGCDDAYNVDNDAEVTAAEPELPADEEPMAAADDEDDTESMDEDPSSEDPASDDNSGSKADTFCEPDEAHPCVCTNGESGMQACQKDGWGLTACMCDGPSSGEGGASSNPGGDDPSEGGAPSTDPDPGSTGGTSNPNPSGNTGGTGGTGNVTPDPVVNNTTLIVTFQAWENFPAWSFTHLSPKNESPDNKDRFFDGQSCEAPFGDVRKCTLTVDLSLAWEFYAKTGLNGAGSYTPGKDGATGKCAAYMDVTVTRYNGSSYVDVPFHMVPRADGCHFRIEPGATLPNLDNANADSDGDGTKNGDESCTAAKSNPSITSCDVSSDPDGSQNASSMKRLAIYTFGADTNSGTRELQVFTGSYRVIGCESVVFTDPQGGNTTANTVRCMVDVDRSKEFEHLVHVGSQWSVGANNGSCQRWFREYIYELGNDNVLRPVADFDQSATNLGQQIEMRYMSNQSGCHLVLPKAS